MSTRLPGLVLTDHELQAPLDHTRPDGERITVYAREVVAAGKDVTRLPWLVFLQGGPGHKSPRPIERGGWIGRAVDDYRVLLLDQRGTGRSTPVTARTLARLGSARAQADYLTHFRADSIVRDAELFRRQLAGVDTWTTLGQSYGGFCTLSYLSIAPESLSACYVTGGLAGLTATAEEVYRRTYPRARAKNAAYYRRYPDDVKAVRGIVAHLAERRSADPVRLPDGGILSAERFLSMGHEFGMTGGYEAIHYLVEEAWDGDELSDAFLDGVRALTTRLGSPLYAAIHEAIYCQGAASNWAAERVRAEFPEFAVDAAEPLFTGEMINSSLFDEDPALRPYADAAHLLAAKADWGPLYDLDAITNADLPVAAAVYHDDMYVDADLSLQTAARLPDARVWVTNEYEHNGLRADGGRVLGRLIDLARGNA